METPTGVLLATVNPGIHRISGRQLGRVEPVDLRLDVLGRGTAHRRGAIPVRIGTTGRRIERRLAGVAAVGYPRDAVRDQSVVGRRPLLVHRHVVHQGLRRHRRAVGRVGRLILGDLKIRVTRVRRHDPRLIANEIVRTIELNRRVEVDELARGGAVEDRLTAGGRLGQVVRTERGRSPRRHRRAVSDRDAGIGFVPHRQAADHAARGVAHATEGEVLIVGEIDRGRTGREIEFRGRSRRERRVRRHEQPECTSGTSNLDRADRSGFLDVPRPTHPVERGRRDEFVRRVRGGVGRRQSIVAPREVRLVRAEYCRVRRVRRRDRAEADGRLYPGVDRLRLLLIERLGIITTDGGDVVAVRVVRGCAPHDGPIGSEVIDVGEVMTDRSIALTHRDSILDGEVRVDLGQFGVGQRTVVDSSLGQRALPVLGMRIPRGGIGTHREHAKQVGVGEQLPMEAPTGVFLATVNPRVHRIRSRGLRRVEPVDLRLHVLRRCVADRCASGGVPIRVRAAGCRVERRRTAAAPIGDAGNAVRDQRVVRCRPLLVHRHVVQRGLRRHG